MSVFCDHPAAFKECTANGSPVDGQFFIYGREGKPQSDEVVLCVIYKGKPTHHLMQSKEGSWVVNKKSYGEFESLTQVHARSTHAVPVKLLADFVCTQQL